MVATTSLRTVPLVEIVAGITASACGSKDYHRKQEEIHVICVTSQLSFIPKLSAGIIVASMLIITIDSREQGLATPDFTPC